MPAEEAKSEDIWKWSGVAAFAVTVEEVDGDYYGDLYNRDDDETEGLTVADEIRTEDDCHGEKVEGKH